MDKRDKSPNDPRWGQEGRDWKAEAIVTTLQLHCGQDFASGTWLDVGCGSGGIAATLAGHVRQIVGVDPEPWDRWQESSREHSNLRFHVGTYHDLVSLLGRDACDVVICNQVYEHVDDPLALLASIHSVLKADGVCYFAGPNLLWPIEPHVHWPFVHWLPRSFAQYSMRVLGSKRARDLDAYSWPYWKLVRHIRLSGFNYSSAIPERLKAELAHNDSVLLRIATRVPRIFFCAFAPLSPGFVFVLRKRAN